MSRKPDTQGTPLRRGWTTGACAAAAARAATQALLTGDFPDPVAIRLPRGETPAFPLALEKLGDGVASAGIVKDAGDDPDVTHGVTVISTVRETCAGSGIAFRGGRGIGTVTRDGLPLAVGEPAINPAPRALISDAVTEIAARHNRPADFEIEVSIPGGEALAGQTWNPRLGIEGGLSVLGTTGVVIPYSCAAWIESIHRGIDVARAAGLDHVAGCTGSTSEKTVQTHFGLPDIAMLDMGDFAGGLLKYLRRHPIPRLTVGGGFAKLTKLAQGNLDLHSGRSQVDFDWLTDRLVELGAANDLCQRIPDANTAAEVLTLADRAGLPLADTVAARAARTARDVAGEEIAVGVLVVGRDGRIAGRSQG